MKRQTKKIELASPPGNEDLPAVVQANVLNGGETNAPLSPASTCVMGRRET